MPKVGSRRYLDEWLAVLAKRLEGRGKRAELARFLEAEMGLAWQTAQNRVGLMLGGDYTPSGETVLVVSEWLRRQG